MYVNIEFLDTEPIENVITAMHFAVDKTIFIGYPDVKKEYGTQTEGFLKNYCGVKQVEFYEASSRNLQEVVQTLREMVEEEQAAGNQVFFDITGGEGLILVAFGMLAKEYRLPMHLYDIEADLLHELNPEDAKPISAYGALAKEKVKLDLDTYIRMQGAKISSKQMPGAVDTSDSVFLGRVEKLWEVLCDYKDAWNFYAQVLAGVFKTDSLYADGVLDSKRVKDLGAFAAYLKRLEAAGGIYKLRVTHLPQEQGLERLRISYYYDSEDMKYCLIKGGNTLELHTFHRMKKQSYDCRQSVVIDWDGVEHTHYGIDVLNEIDVLCIKGNIPTFVSCKGGQMDDGQALQPLYELETIANRFGGKYARKVLATVHPLHGVYAKRAEEMGIKVEVAKNEDNG